MSDRDIVFVGGWDMYKSGAPDTSRLYWYRAATGELDRAKPAPIGMVVGAACIDRDRNILYCVEESTTLPGYFRGGGGQVHAFAIDRETADMTELNRRPSFGSLPSGVAVDGTGKYLIVSHHTDRTPVTTVVKDPSGAYRIALVYDDATTVLFRLGKDGSIGEPCDVHTHTGAGGPLARQTHPQLHSVTASPSGKLFVVCDKGNDEIVVFRINHETHRLEVCGEGFKSIPGSSPRYAVFHPTRPFLFVNHETRAVVSALRYDEDGRLDLIGTADALPEGAEDGPDIKQSDIGIHPSGRYLYSLVRGADAASVFAIDQGAGGLTRLQTVALDGGGPRGCAVSPDGRFLLVAALTSNKVLVWAIGDDGTLAPTGKGVDQPTPGNLLFL